ncbi:MAG: hypothetical protein ACI9XO_000463 [Paraglaciecola sp.]|jgi:hypothetical protein
MKKTLTMLLLSAAISMSAQQDETIFFDINRVGIFGGPIFEFTALNDEVNTATGGGGAIILNNFFVGAYGMKNSKIDGFDFNTASEQFTDIRFKHGGFWLGGTPLQSKAVHPYFSGRIGWGNTSYSRVDLSSSEEVQFLKDEIFVLTPEVGVEFNIFRFFRIAVTADYRYVSGVEDANPLTNKDLSTFGGAITLRFGSFGNFWWSNSYDD